MVKVLVQTRLTNAVDLKSDWTMFTLDACALVEVGTMLNHLKCQ